MNDVRFTECMRIILYASQYSITWRNHFRLWYIQCDCVCLCVLHFPRFRSWALSTGHSGGLSSSKEEVGEVGSYDLPPMLRLLHCHQRPPPGGGRSQPGTVRLNLTVTYSVYSQIEHNHSNSTVERTSIRGSRCLLLKKTSKSHSVLVYLYPTFNVECPLQLLSVLSCGGTRCSEDLVSRDVFKKGSQLSVYLLIACLSIRITPTQICPHYIHRTWQCWKVISHFSQEWAVLWNTCQFSLQEWLKVTSLLHNE